jgi:hypothetical protein
MLKARNGLHQGLWEGKAMGNQPPDDKRLKTLSIEGRRLIGQAIIDGLLTPSAVIAVAATKDYNQNGGNYTQRGSGDHVQVGNGDYNQAASISNLQDIVSIIRQAGVIREE